MATPIALSAKNARVEINGAIFANMDWEVDPTTEWLDRSNAEDGGFGTQVADFFDANVTVEGFWDAGNIPHVAPLGIVAGVNVLNVKLYIDFVNLPDLFWLFPIFSIKTAPASAKVKGGMIKQRMEGKNYGTFSYPSLGAPAAAGQSDILLSL